MHASTRRMTTRDWKLNITETYLNSTIEIWCKQRKRKKKDRKSLKAPNDATTTIKNGANAPSLSNKTFQYRFSFFFVHQNKYVHTPCPSRVVSHCSPPVRTAAVAVIRTFFYNWQCRWMDCQASESTSNGDCWNGAAKRRYWFSHLRVNLSLLARVLCPIKVHKSFTSTRANPTENKSPFYKCPRCCPNRHNKFIFPETPENFFALPNFRGRGRAFDESLLIWFSHRDGSVSTRRGSIWHNNLLVTQFVIKSFPPFARMFFPSIIFCVVGGSLHHKKEIIFIFQLNGLRGPGNENPFGS